MSASPARPVRVHLMGAAAAAGAPDDGELQLHGALLALGDLVELAPLESAEIVHAIGADRLLALDPREIDGKRVLCHLTTEVGRAFESPLMIRARARVGLWLTVARAAAASLEALGYRAAYLPPGVDTRVCTERLPEGVRRSELRARWNIPPAARAVANFATGAGVEDDGSARARQGADLLLRILEGVRRRGLPVHALLTGSGGDGLRTELAALGVPCTVVGRPATAQAAAPGADPEAPAANLLYHAADLYLLTSRWDGWQAVLEAGATRTPILSTPVGPAADVLEPQCLIRSVDEGIAAAAAALREGALEAAVAAHHRRVQHGHTTEAAARALGELYRTIETVPVFRASQKDAAGLPAADSHPPRRLFALGALARSALGLRPRAGAAPCIGFWHEFHKPPYGGGNQFMTALRAALLRLGVRVVSNRMSSSVDVHLCNSAWFDVKIFERAARRRRVRMIHRVDGPVALYRGTDWSEDERIHDLNRRHAAATVFQSDWSFRKLKEHGLEFVRPMIIRNAPDPAFFHPAAERPPLAGRKIRLISTAWSDNPSKGGDLYRWLDEHLDWGRFEYTFVGRIGQRFRNVRHIPPQDSRELGALLRSHDIYVTASRNDPCSNALLEGLFCGLPALYYQHGGHGELAGFAGLPFSGPEDVLPQLERLAANLEAFRGCFWLPSIDDIARRYLELARLLMADER